MLQKHLVRLACIRHAASVHPEPGSNSPQKIITFSGGSFKVAVVIQTFGLSSYHSSVVKVLAQGRRLYIRRSRLSRLSAVFRRPVSAKKYRRLPLILLAGPHRPLIATSLWAKPQGYSVFTDPLSQWIIFCIGSSILPRPISLSRGFSNLFSGEFLALFLPASTLQRISLRPAFRLLSCN